MVLRASEEVAVEEPRVAVARPGFLGACVEHQAARAAVVFLRQYYLVAVVHVALGARGGGGVIVAVGVHPRAEGGLRGAGIEEAGVVEVEILPVAVEGEGLAVYALGVGVALGRRR